jgi:type II secretion system protein H
MAISKNNKGFTLVEVMIVVAIIGILSAMAAPSYKKFTGHQNLNGAARELFSDVRGARVLAIKEGSQYGIYITSATTFQVIKVASPAYTSFAQSIAASMNPFYTAVTAYDLNALGYTGVTITIPNNMNMPLFQRTGAVSGINNITSNSAGFSTSAPANIVLTNSYGETKTISVNSAGYALIQ